MSRNYMDQDGFLMSIKNETSQRVNNENNLGNTKYSETKLWISDILKTQCHFTPVNKLDFNEKKYYGANWFNFDIVDIYGVITGMSENQYAIYYKVEDGTGEICCWFDKQLWLNKFKESTNSYVSNVKQNNQNEDLIMPLSCEQLYNKSSITYGAVLNRSQWLHKQVCDEIPRLENVYISNTVHVRGKIINYKEEKCVKIYSIRLVTDVNEETDRRFELIHHYECINKN